MNNYSNYGRSRGCQYPEYNYNERPDVERPPRNKKIPLAVKIIILVLLCTIVLYSTYAFLVQPVDELNVRLALGRNCRIRITLTSTSYNYQRVEYVIELDDNVMLVTSGSEKHYYITEDNKTYEYCELSNGTWRKYAVNSGSSSGSSINFEFLLDRDNYERAAWWKPFTWRVKNGTTEVTRVVGKIKFSQDHSFYEQTIVFDHIGITKIDRPWAESQK
ncbi:MAG: hypothetical protein IJ345_03620 [Clostridia bacterium]|nr:hypothetical protein [Clostridia bacterium]